MGHGRHEVPKEGEGSKCQGKKLVQEIGAGSPGCIIGWGSHFVSPAPVGVPSPFPPGDVSTPPLATEQHLSQGLQTGTSSHISPAKPPHQLQPELLVAAAELR